MELVFSSVDTWLEFWQENPCFLQPSTIFEVEFRYYRAEIRLCTSCLHATKIIQLSVSLTFNELKEICGM
jgi:hypothetical protein